MPQQIITDLLIKQSDPLNNTIQQPLHIINNKDIITQPRFLLNGNLNLEPTNIEFITSLANNSSTYIQIHSQDYFYLKMSFDESLNVDDVNLDIATFTIKTKSFSYSNHLVPLYVLIANGTQDIDLSTGLLTLSATAKEVNVNYLLAGHSNSTFQDVSSTPINDIGSGTF
ncbi:MAG: hypothetical protein DRG78_00230 [Epsilonproteobacteria bacterium]|nr:MAG: hypothetical protein DRG78_00230 [Campylobacterota bacterium]